MKNSIGQDMDYKVGYVDSNATAIPYNMEFYQNINNQTAKADNGKLQISLVPTQIIKDIARVRMYGNKKYHDPNNWKLVDKQRYVDALLRHIISYIDDPEGVDEESGIPHYMHAACNLAFICQMEEWERRRKNSPFT